MKFEVRPSGNGWIIEFGDGESPLVCQTEEDEVDAWASLLRRLLAEYGPIGGSYDNKRIYITVAPGDKHEAFEDTLFYRLEK